MPRAPDIELQGVYLGSPGKAYLFKADYWAEAQFLPRSQCSFTLDPLAEEPGRGTMRIAGWLADKNGWSEHGEG